MGLPRGFSQRDIMAKFCFTVATSKSATKAILLVCVHPCPQQHLGNLEDSLIVISCNTEVKRSKASKVQYVDFGFTTVEFQYDLEILDRMVCGLSPCSDAARPASCRSPWC